MTKSELQPYVEAIVNGQNLNARVSAADALLALFPASDGPEAELPQSDNPFAKNFVAPKVEEATETEAQSDDQTGEQGDPANNDD
jgi:hypothetical protein